MAREAGRTQRRSAKSWFNHEGLLRVTAAVKWYEMQLISQAKAAEIAGLSRHDFLLALSRFNVSPFQTTPEELRKEIERD